MKIAVLSDIHGNMDALEEVLKDLKKERCEKVFVLGDYAMAGPEPETVVNWAYAKIDDPTYSLIQGNTDLMIADYTPELRQKMEGVAPVMAEALSDDVVQLNQNQKEFLKNLPSKLEIEIEGVKFLLVHGSPRRNNEDILPDTPVKQVETMIDGVNADVVLCGHTHIPCGFQTASRKTVVNVGSVGRPFTPEPKACYLVITVSNGKCIFNHKFVEYNKERAALKLRGRKFVGSAKLANTLLNPEFRHF